MCPHSGAHFVKFGDGRKVRVDLPAGMAPGCGDHHFRKFAYNILMPYPNTPLYRKLEQEGRLLYGGKWWLHPEYRFNSAAYVPTRMSADELTAACHAARTRFNSLGSLLSRFADPKTHLRSASRIGAYWYYTLIFRKELYKKHGMRFGLR